MSITVTPQSKQAIPFKPQFRGTTGPRSQNAPGNFPPSQPKFGANDLFPLEGSCSGLGDFIGKVAVAGLLIMGPVAGWLTYKNHQKTEERADLANQYAIVSPDFEKSIEQKIDRMNKKERVLFIMEQLPSSNQRLTGLASRMIEKMEDPKLQSQLKSLQDLYKNNSDKDLIELFEKEIKNNLG